MADNFKIPEEWELSEQQELVIGSLVDYAGEYISPAEFCFALYDEEIEGPAPAKLRVLMQRCRQILDEITGEQVDIEVKRNKGWRITKKGRILLKRAANGELNTDE